MNKDGEIFMSMSDRIKKEIELLSKRLEKVKSEEIERFNENKIFVGKYFKKNDDKNYDKLYCLVHVLGIQPDGHIETWRFSKEIYGSGEGGSVMKIFDNSVIDSVLIDESFTEIDRKSFLEEYQKLIPRPRT